MRKLALAGGVLLFFGTAANAGEILKTETAISELAWRLAEGDKTKSQIEDSIVPKAIRQLGNVYANFQTYSSQTGPKAGPHTLQKFMEKQGYAAQGVQQDHHAARPRGRR